MEINPIKLRTEHIFFGFVFFATIFWLRSVTDFSFKFGFVVISLALVSTLPLGWLIVTLLLPDLRIESVRIAIAIIVGYVGSILVGFFLGVLNQQWAYLPFCFICLMIWLLLLYRRGWFAFKLWPRFVMAPKLLQVLGNRPVWIIAGIGLLNTIVATPFMSPLKRISPNLLIDFADIDTYFHTIRAHVLSLGAPASINPELAGLRPVVYPDFHNFWIGQLSHWSQADVNDVYFMYVPIVTLMFSAFILYAVGKSFTGSQWGGYLAVALAYLILLPNPYDPNLFFENTGIHTGISVGRVRFQDLHDNLSYGIGWQILSAITLIILFFPRYLHSRTGLGLFTITGILLISLTRIRPHFFVAMTPPALLLCVGLVLYWRKWKYLIPLAFIAALFLLLYFESTSLHYNNISTGLSIWYGPFGEMAISILPDSIRSLIVKLPSGLGTFLGILLYVILYMIGFAYTLVLLLWGIQILRHRQHLNIAVWYLVLVFLSALISSMLIVLDARREDFGGAWGIQALYIVPWITILLVLSPLYSFFVSMVRRISFIKDNIGYLSFGLLMIFTLIAHRGADAMLHEETSRGYLLTQNEIDVYYWIKENTSPHAIVAAHPNHQVNFIGETIRTTNFLSGMTRRPAYLQRAQGYDLDEANRRIELLNRLFEAKSADDVNSLLNQMSFDYLLIYPDTPTEVDLSCCLRLIVDGPPKVFEVSLP